VTEGPGAQGRTNGTIDTAGNTKDSASAVQLLPHGTPDSGYDPLDFLFRIDDELMRIKGHGCVPHDKLFYSHESGIVLEENPGFISAGEPSKSLC
jgi:hypothetical protein